MPPNREYAVWGANRPNSSTFRARPFEKKILGVCRMEYPVLLHQPRILGRDRGWAKVVEGRENSCLRGHLLEGETTDCELYEQSVVR